MVFFIIIQVFIKDQSTNSGEPDQTPCFTATDLGIHCLPVSHKKDARFICIYRHCTTEVSDMWLYKPSCSTNSNPFMPNVFSNPYQLDESISNFRVVGWYFSFYSKFMRNIFLQTVGNPIRRRKTRRLIWLFTVCRCPTKRRQL